MHQPPNSAPLAPGTMLAGKYRIDKVLGEGGMGVVVQATHVQLNQRVALKFLLPAACAIPEAVERFLREARAAVQIRSEHVARVIDVGTLETGAPYMVMEFLAGHDLATAVERGGPMPIPQATDYVLQAIEAVAEAHALGIVHRDLKPANLFLTSRADGSPLVKVLDFGISKVVDEQGSANLTATSTSMGSPMYMSPEQVRSTKGVDVRTDVWALGIILYELVSGRVPFDAPTVSGILAQIIADPPKPLREVRPDVPPELDQIIHECLQKERELRIANVADLARRLAQFCPDGDASAGRTSKVLRSAGFKVDSIAPGTVLPGGAGTKATWAQTAPQKSRGSKAWLAAAAAVALLGAGGAAYQLTRGEASAEETAPPEGEAIPAAEPVKAPEAAPVLAPPTSGITPVSEKETTKPAVQEPAPQPSVATPVPTPAAPTPRATVRPKPKPTPKAAAAAPEPAPAPPPPRPKPRPKYNPLLDGR